MSESRPVDALPGTTLKTMVEHLVERYGWEGLGARIDIRCFTQEPSVPSSLKFLRKTPWARRKSNHSTCTPWRTPERARCQQIAINLARTDHLDAPGMAHTAFSRPRHVQ